MAIWMRGKAIIFAINGQRLAFEGKGIRWGTPIRGVPLLAISLFRDND